MSHTGRALAVHTQASSQQCFIVVHCRRSRDNVASLLLDQRRARRRESRRPPTLAWSSLVERDGGSTASSSGREKQYDVVALSNLCVDIVSHMNELPTSKDVKSEAMLRKLTAQPPDVKQWEVGGNCNFLIAAARLGLSVASIGNLGSDIYGDFVRRILKEEGIHRLEPLASVQSRAELQETLLCFVLVAPGSAHAFCSRYDFGPWPLLPGISELPPGALQVLRNTKAVFANGFVFDELPPEVVVHAMGVARRAGAAVFFDPGPRCWTMRDGPRRAGLDAVMDLCDVILMTEEEALALTGETDPEKAAQAVLNRPGAATQWCVVKLGARGALLCQAGAQSPVHQPALQVEVQDTVGCGDSFAAAVVLGYTRQQPIPALLALANAVGAATALGTGAGRNVASAAKVLDLLAREAAWGTTNGNGTGHQGTNGARERDAAPAATAIDILRTTLDEADAWDR